MQIKFLRIFQLETNPQQFMNFAEVLECYDQSLAAKFYINAIFYITILSMGTKRHQQILEKCVKNEVFFLNLLFFFKILFLKIFEIYRNMFSINFIVMNLSFLKSKLHVDRK